MTGLAPRCVLLLLLAIGVTMQHNHSGEIDTYHVSVGHVFLLSCLPDQTEVMWSRGDGPTETLPTDVEVRDGLLWFLPVEMSHHGAYICEKRDETELLKRTFRVSVSNEDCPDPSEDVVITEGIRGGLPCKQTELFGLGLVRRIRWMKDCNLEELDKEFISADGFMWLPAVSQRDAGKYTCLTDITIDGRNYTTARSIQMTVKNGAPEVFPELQVVKPQEDVFIVQVGKRAELQCLAYTGFSESEEIIMFWTIDGVLTDAYKELNESWRFIHNRGKVYGQSNLSISIVRHQFLNVPIHCNVWSPVEAKFGLARLKEADPFDFHVIVTLCVTASIFILLMATFFFFKVDLVLAHRKLTRHFSKPQVSHGKLYDAYVSVVQSNTGQLTETAKFALQILPEELEKKHGFSLYIQGRDGCPGEAIHDAISAALHQCHTMIIILSPDGKAKGTRSLCETQLLYEQEVGLYDALTQNDPKIILVEVDGPLDYSQLPESLRYIKRKQGALKWNNVLVGTNKLTTFYSKRNFWKNLQYHMPAVPVRRLHPVP
ncbi:interleukin-1 receptor type 1-like [Nematolebias whitei]|uniref:interleukin-1 receptor type 1-like n=1 Tax=Nematolebias whitei TaxID=451745 RepID=UPI001896AF55|nr:interleukin-1 receptor type 1-like [Nematolebias whitei]